MSILNNQDLKVKELGETRKVFREGVLFEMDLKKWT